MFQTGYNNPARILPRKDCLSSGKVRPTSTNITPLVVPLKCAAKTRSARQGHDAGQTAFFPKDGGTTIKYGAAQIAVFELTSRGDWHA
jgi:hypothetical protein